MLENMAFRQMDLFPSSGERKVTLLLFGSLEKKDPVAETPCFLVFRIPDDGQSSGTR
jgi:hypothetical protein